MPLFECTRCGRRIRTEYEISCTGDVKRNVEKAPECCNKAMIETVDD
jgi:sarcosine oxidase delta subunit